MVEMGLYLDIARLIVGVSILGYASYTDIKTRRASNYLWIIMGGIGAVLLVINLLSFSNNEFELAKMYLIFIPVMIIFVYIMFQLRLIFGGADAKALMALAILLPFPFLTWLPETAILPNLPLGETYLPYSWAAFFNSLLFFLAVPLALFFYNLFKFNFSFPHSFLGYKMKISKAREKFVWPLEKMVDGKRKFMYMPKDFDIEEELQEFEKHNIDTIWVTPKIPFMIPLLVGFISVFIVGDILTQIMNLFS